MSYHSAQEFCRHNYNGRLLTLLDSGKMEFIASVLSSFGWQTNYASMSALDTVKESMGMYSHRMVWLGLFYSDQWRWPVLAGMYLSNAHRETTSFRSRRISRQASSPSHTANTLLRRHCRLMVPCRNKMSAPPHCRAVVAISKRRYVFGRKICLLL